MSNQLVVDFDKWCQEQHQKTKLPKQMMCQKAIDHFKDEFSPDFIRKHTDEIYKQRYRQSNAKKRDYNKSRIKKLKEKFSAINIDDVGVLLHESVSAKND